MLFRYFPGGSVVKNLPAHVGDTGLLPGSGRSPGGVNGTPLQYSCLENSTDRGAWWAPVHGVTKSQTQLSGQHVHALSKLYPLPFHWKPSPKQRCHPSRHCCNLKNPRWRLRQVKGLIWHLPWSSYLPSSLHQGWRKCPPVLQGTHNTE